MHLVARFEVPGLARHAAQQGVSLVSTRAYYAGPAPANEFILRCSALGEKALRAGVRRLASQP